MLDPGARSALTLLVLSASAAACADRDLADLPIGAAGETETDFTVALDRDLDLLFIVDDSNSMKREQDEMATHFRKMIAVLDRIPGGRPNLHIGVVSTDVGAAAGCAEPAVPPGQLRNAPNPSGRANLAGCVGPSGRFLEDVREEGSSNRTRNYPEGVDLADAFACIATLGTGGCGFEAPLEAMTRALSPENEVNAGFVRDGALLAVVFLTDEDDCSASDPRMFGRVRVVDGHDLGPPGNFRCFREGVVCADGPPEQPGARRDCAPRDDSPFLTPVADYAAALRHLRPNPTRTIVAGIMGAPEVSVTRDRDGNPALASSCSLPGTDPSEPTATETAFPPVRTEAFLAHFEQRVRTQICAEDLSSAMEQIGAYIASRLPGRCLLGPVFDVDAQVPGVQPDCAVIETIGPSSPKPSRTRLPACEPTGTPTQACWRVAPNPEQCSDTPTQLEVSVHYPEGASRPPDTAIEIRCRSR